MKKLLLLGVLLALGTTANALTYTDNYGGFNDPQISGQATVTGPWRDITDSNRNVDQVNRFIKKGRGRKDADLMLVLLKIHKPISIEAETHFLYGEGVVGDKLEFGDIEFIVKGTKDAEADFYFLGPVFDMMKGATLEAQGNVEVIAGNGLNGQSIGLDTIDLGYHNDEVSIEMDLYFKLEEPGIKGGIVIATAEYK